MPPREAQPSGAAARPARLIPCTPPPQHAAYFSAAPSPPQGPTRRAPRSSDLVESKSEGCRTPSVVHAAAMKSSILICSAISRSKRPITAQSLRSHLVPSATSCPPLSVLAQSPTDHSAAARQGIVGRSVRTATTKSQIFQLCRTPAHVPSSWPLSPSLSLSISLKLVFFVEAVIIAEG